mmetsp:Transcript_103812/g.183104  ORF Transcript_103812/g.183104 Transcript_103812/m.183104 type:complete len:203 (+) Transcript_103812:99-707(+)
MGNRAGAGVQIHGTFPISLKVRTSSVKRVRQPEQDTVKRKSSLRKRSKSIDLANLASIVSGSTCASSVDHTCSEKSHTSKVSFCEQPDQVIECQVHKPMHSLAKHKERSKKVHCQPAYATADWIIPSKQMWTNENAKSDNWNKDLRQNNYTWQGLYSVSCKDEDQDSASEPPPSPLRGRMETDWRSFESRLGIRRAQPSHTV